MSKDTRNKIRFTEQNKKFLEKIKNEYSLKSLPEAVNFIISQYIFATKYSSNNNDEYFKKLQFNKYEQLEFYYRIRLTPSENYFLNQEKQRHGFRSMTSEIRFRLVNSLYDFDILSRVEVENFLLMLKEINTLSKLNKKINNEEIKEKINNIKKDFVEIRQYIKEIAKVYQMIGQF